ncbi:MAG: radical SAM protein [Myxococcales bacterium]|nr:radical SAM protein [Myxococcales bacterium]MCB9731472.1 radical SAM protein [Deltaproteobacteria bacterium]
MLAGFVHEVRRAYHDAGMLFELQLDLLYQCDLDCQHCYLDDKARRILPLAFWKGVIDQAADMQVFTLLLSGGEAFLRKDLLEIVAHARARGLFVHLKSHGGHVTPEVARRLAALGVSSVWLSYYAEDPAVHDAITRRPGSHAKTLAAIHALKDAGVTVLVACAVMHDNRDHWRGVVRQCLELGVPVSLDGEIRAAHSGDRFPRRIALAHDDLVALEDAKLDQQGGGCEVPSASNGWGSEKNCAAGTLALYVSPEGDVTPCVTWPESLGNLAAGDTLRGIWAESARLRTIQARRKLDRAVCATCAVREQCDFCMGQSFVERGDENAPVEAVCLTTRAKSLARARRLGLPEPPLPAGLERPRFHVLTAAERAAIGR